MDTDLLASKLVPLTMMLSLTKPESLLTDKVDRIIRFFDAVLPVESVAIRMQLPLAILTGRLTVAMNVPLISVTIDDVDNAAEFKEIVTIDELANPFR
jgi:hypothetical protein